MRRILQRSVTVVREPLVSPVVVTAAVHALLFGLCGIFAFLLRFDFGISPHYRSYMWLAIAVWIPVKLLCFHAARLNQVWSRHVSVQDVTEICWATFAGSVASCLVI